MNQSHVIPTYWQTHESDSEIALTNIAKKYEVIFNTKQTKYYEKLTEAVKDFVKFLDSELGQASGANDGETVEVIIDFLFLISKPYTNSEEDIILLFQHYHFKEECEVHFF